MKFDIATLDKQMAFLHEQAQRLRSNQKGGWVEGMAKRYDEIRETLHQVRQHQQMTGVGGKKIE